MSDDGTVGTGHDPVNVYAQLDPLPFRDLVDGATAHIDEFHLETARGEYTFHAEDDVIVMEFTEGGND